MLLNRLISENYVQEKIETMSIEKLHALGKSLSSPFYPSKNITFYKIQKFKN